MYVSGSRVVTVFLLLLCGVQLGTKAQALKEDQTETLQIVAPRVQALQNAIEEQYVIEDHHYGDGTMSQFLNDAVGGVALNGQGGLFQVVSVRGLSGWRVKTLLANVPLTTERRAGNALSFLDSDFIDSVGIVKGAMSTHFGSGALGGALQLQPRFFEQTMVKSEVNLGQSGKKLFVGVGGDSYSFASSLRSFGNTQTSNGLPLYTQYEQFSSLFQYRWYLDGGQEVTLMVLPSWTRDIGKSSIDYPDTRITTYPKDDHFVVSFNIQDQALGYFSLFVHDQKLITEVDRVGQRFNVVNNNAFDWGVYWQNQGQSGRVDWQYGVDSLNRNAVTVDEAEFVDDALQFSQRSLSGAEQDFGLFTNATLSFRDASFGVGTRWNHQKQSAGRQRDSNRFQSFYTAFEWLLSPSWSTRVMYGQGYRFPSLSERYYSGSSGRGTLSGNSQLQTEKAQNVEWQLRMALPANGAFRVAVFRQRIEDYIERVRLTDDINSFANEQDVSIDGFELSAFFEPFETLKVHFAAQKQRGRNQAGTVVNDIPPQNIELGFHYESERFLYGLKYNYRFRLKRPGRAELARNSANTVAAFVRYFYTDDLSFSLNISNLSDESYFITGDDKSTMAPERAYTMGVQWWF